MLSITGKNAVFTVLLNPNTTTIKSTITPNTTFFLLSSALVIAFLYLSLKALYLTALSLFPAIFSTFRNTLATIGTKSIATTIEADKANIIEKDIPLNTSFAIPSKSITGKNTQTDVAVDAIIGTITSFVPRTAATSAGSLLSCI